MSEALMIGLGLAVLITVVAITLHSKMSAVHAAALAPVTVALVPAAGFSPAPPAGVPEPAPQPAQPPAAAVPVPLPPGGNTTDPTAPGFIAPPAAPAPVEVAAPSWAPAPVMTFADCTGQNIPLNPGTTYTITDCPAATNVETNITTLPCDPYVLTVNGVGTPKEIQTGQCTVYASGPTVVVSVAPMAGYSTVNLILQVQPGA